MHLVALYIMKACSSTKSYLKANPLLSTTLFMVLIIKLHAICSKQNVDLFFLSAEILSQCMPGLNEYLPVLFLLCFSMVLLRLK